LALRSSVNDVGTAMTRKDFAMNWDQIENKWMAMTRRIRSDRLPDRIDATGATTGPLVRRGKAGLIPANIADNQAASVENPNLKISAK
jgi:hypothetical protein